MRYGQSRVCRSQPSSVRPIFQLTELATGHESDRQRLAQPGLALCRRARAPRRCRRRGQTRVQAVRLPRAPARARRDRDLGPRPHRVRVPWRDQPRTGGLVGQRRDKVAGWSPARRLLRRRQQGELRSLSSSGACRTKRRAVKVASCCLHSPLAALLALAALVPLALDCYGRAPRPGRIRPGRHEGRHDPLARAAAADRHRADSRSRGARALEARQPGRAHLARGAGASSVLRPLAEVVD